jgi:phenylalanyl-tRNA synthetase alpha chain
MEAKKISEALQDAEVSVLKALAKKPLESDELAKTSMLSRDIISRACLWLQNKALVTVKETSQSFAALDKLGEKYITEGLPEKKFLAAIKEKPLYTDEIATKANLDKQEITFSLGHLKKHNIVAFEGGKIRLLDKRSLEQKRHDELLLERLAKEKEVELNLLPKEEKFAFDELRPRGIVRKIDRTIREFAITDLGKKVISATTDEKRIGLLTPDLIKTGAWKNASFRRYDVETAVPKIYPGKKQAYKAFLDEVKEELVSLGFEEMTGPLVETALFDTDALYMPQDHPARGIHDIYFVKEPKYGNIESYKKILKEIKQVHENGGKTGSLGWQTPFDAKESARLLLRSQGTALSARMLANPDIKIPGAYFAVARVFRPDKLDATHLTEFNQLEGIVLGDKLNLRHLLGLLKEFAKKIAGTDKIKFVPAYFPFTEPSVQAMIFHQKLNKWIEAMPGGIFRPEVTAPFGIKVPVLAWGIGIDRLFMVRNNITDIRQLFSQDINWLREAKI